MSADPIIYCLEHLTDYRQFERLCSDLMNGCGYPTIDPLGGSSDSGRDALFYAAGQEPTIFAYTVRTDWRRKLLSDCERIKEEGHELSALVYVCTSTLTAFDKDEIRSHVLTTFGWRLEVYDLERIRVLLAGTLRHLVARHPAIFCPPWFPQRGGLSISASADIVVIDHVAADHALATWLDRRLSLEGYRTWCYGTAPLAGEDANESVRILIQNRAQQYLPVLSPEAVADRDFIDRCGLAGVEEHRVLPCWSADVTGLLPARLARISPARFQDSWSTGLTDVLRNLYSRGITPTLDSVQGRAIALRAYVPDPVIRVAPERVFANVFPVILPKSILIYQLNQPLAADAEGALRKTWAFSCVDPRNLFAFESSPAALPTQPGTRPIEYAWSDHSTYFDRPTYDVVKELIWRSLDVACVSAGLQWCADRKVFYFPKPEAGERNVSFVHVEGRSTRVAMTGERQYGWGDRASQFRYQLGPRFRVGRDESGQWWVTLLIYVRVTDFAGACFQLKDISRRRKAVTKSWWNREWLARLLGLMQALTTEGNETIQIGSGRRAVTVSVKPLEWECPMSIDVEAMDHVGDFQEEMSLLRFADEEESNEGPEPDSEADEDRPGD